MDSALLNLKSLDDLLVYDNFQESLSFKGTDRTFKSVVVPYRFKDMIPCGIANCRQKHLEGYLVSTSDELLIAIGKDCGRREFGVEFTRDRKRVDGEVAKARRIRTILAFKESLPSMIEELAQIERDYKRLQELRNRLMGAVSLQAYQQIKRRADLGDNQIMKSVPMTKEEAEIVWQTTNRRPNDGKGWPHKEMLLATLEGLAFMKNGFKVTVHTGLLVPLENLQRQTVEEISSMRNKALSNEAKWVGEVPTRIRQSRDLIEAGWRFFTRENIEKLKHMGVDMSALIWLLKDLPK
ncbi:hypothetical protein [Ectopseudomonas guguanensis]|uniref:Uncharacterized protein n=1 Tax=Ectopseudomonas guguanensis TaxID=1198456 RepID=A0A1H0S240_9GAMM|nr:hypothetical protein [Pseudomonas guguanensis]SDP35695.1 hypothetical protein SAMN05216213_103398 [Pseudomonas guguanensis]